MKCSLIIPAYNAEKTIGSCLESALAQSLPRENYEIIVIDDGSTDKTPEIVRNYPVRLIKQENQGPAAARNKGAIEAKGDILIFTDSDCELDSNFLEKIIAPIEQSTEIAGVQGSYKTKQKEFMAQFAQIEIGTRYKRMAKNKYIDFIGTYAAAYKKDIFQKYRGFDTAFPLASGEDTDFSYRLSQNGYKLVFNPQAFVYHKHPSTLKSYLRQKYWRAYWRFLAYRKNPPKAIKDSYTPQSIKIQMLIVGMIGASILSIPIFGTNLGLPILLFLIFITSSLPFAIEASNKNFFIGLLSPAILFIRAWTFLWGMTRGFISQMVIMKMKEWIKRT